MWNLYDIAYGLGLGVSAPYWLAKTSARNKVHRALTDRMGYDIPSRVGNEPCILIHAVSVGEINATRALVQQLRERVPNLKVYVSTTTETGYTRGQELYPPAAGVSLIKYPLDFSSAINRALDSVRPDVVVLMELEVWPNFMLQCERRRIPVVLANARLTTSSFRHYRLGGPIISKMFRRLTLICAQDVTYGERFLQLGVKPTHVVITGTMKFDNASFAPPLPAVRHRAEMLGLRIGEDPMLVCGSTGPGEEAILLQVYRKLLKRFARLRLVIVPRHPPRFDEVQRIIEEHQLPCLRLTRMTGSYLDGETALPPVILIDAMGVLRDFYSVATIVFVGRTLVDLGPRQHGSDMIEPAALGKPILVGPYTANFAEAMRKFLAADAMLEVKDAEGLEQSVAVLLSTPGEAMAMGKRAREVVHREQGATKLHGDVITQILQTKRDDDLGVVQPANPARPAQPMAFSPVQVTVTSPPLKTPPKVIITSISPPPQSQ